MSILLFTLSTLLKGTMTAGIALHFIGRCYYPKRHRKRANQEQIEPATLGVTCPVPRTFPRERRTYFGPLLVDPGQSGLCLLHRRVPICQRAWGKRGGHFKCNTSSTQQTLSRATCTAYNSTYDQLYRRLNILLKPCR